MANPSSKRGFAAMDPARQREIAAKGGRASHGGSSARVAAHGGRDSSGRSRSNRASGDGDM